MNSKITPLFTKLKQIKLEALRLWIKNYLFLPRKYSRFTIPIPNILRIPHISQDTRRYTIPAGTPGAGVGKGGGAGGAIKEGGGGLGKYGAAQEEGYFYHKDKEKIEKLKKTLKTDEGADSTNDGGNKNQQG